LLQQAAFDDTVSAIFLNFSITHLKFLFKIFKMDVNRNVGVRDVCNDDNGPSPVQPFAKLFHYKSLPNIAFGEYEMLSPKIRQTETTFYYRANSSEPNNNYITNPCIIMEKNADNGEAPPSPTEQQEEEHAISGRLEIRVLSKEQMANKEPSPNPEESIYFDAVVTTNGPTNDDEVKPKSEEKKENVQYEEEFIWINKREPQEKKYDIKVYEDSLKIQKYKIITVDKSDDALDGPDDTEDIEKVGEVPESGDKIKESKNDEEGAQAIANPLNEREDIESTTDNRIENDRLRDRDCSSSSNSKIPVFNPSGSSRMLSQRSSWAGMEDGPDLSDLTPGNE
jgi:hypothetical protein